ncbi:MAG: helicase-associated domain-containing protein [Planctomycetes bacterium]|nr:helicase-associated domain-containing protein [Planctomycetota bacterium]
MTRIALRHLLPTGDGRCLRECVQQWCAAANLPEAPAELLAAATAAMEDEARVTARMLALPRKQQDLLEAFFGDGGAVRTVQALFVELGKSFKSRFDLEATLAALQRAAFLWPARDKRWASFDSPCWAVPGELVECVLQSRRRRHRQLQDSLTLQGFLDARYFRDRQEANGATQGATNGHAAAGKRSDGKAADAKAAEQKAADHARKIYKLYTMDSSLQSRLQKLPAPVKRLVDGALQLHGGMASFPELVAELELGDSVDFAFAGKALEEAMLGTAGALDLERLGIQSLPQALVVFHEAALFALRQRGAAAVPTLAGEVVCGGDFATSVVRFLRELQHSKVLFTAEGELFKASHKRIAGLLLPVPGGLLAPEQVLELVYRFCLHRRLIDRRGERSLRPTPAGLEFERESLAEQQKQLLAHFVEDRTLPGEPYHQTRMRRVVLRLLRRAEPMVWQEVSILPFLARNAYLSQIETAPTEAFFATRFQGGGYTPAESVQQMSWNLLAWIKKRLLPLGVVDAGMRDGRVVALRLSRLGAELLDADPAGKVGGVRSSLIVQPDFEILVFPGDDVHEVVHLLDRFARRTKSDHVHQFVLDKASVTAGLADGLTGTQIQQELTDRARVPVPQNVLYSLEEWGQQPLP